MKYSFADDAIRLPPAYAEAEDLLLASLAARRAQSEARTLDTTDPGTGSWHATPAAQDLSNARHLSTRAAVSSFNKIVKEEAAQGRYEIFEADDLMDFLFVCWREIYEPNSASDEELFDIYFKFTSVDANRFKVFLSCFSDFSPSQIELLWDAFKVLFDRAVLEEAKAEVANSEASGILLNGVMNFIRFKNTPLAILEEVYLRNPNNDMFDFRPSSRIRLREDSSTPTGTRLDGPAREFKVAHPQAFMDKVKAAEVDPRVVEVLLEAWEGDCLSLMEASLTLSAEKSS